MCAKPTCACPCDCCARDATRTLLYRLLEKATYQPDGCLVWTGLARRGYGQLRVGGRKLATHRIAYALFVAPIGEALTVDHLCRNRACFNPLHMELVTAAENTRRARAHRRRLREAATTGP